MSTVFKLLLAVLSVCVLATLRFGNWPVSWAFWFQKNLGYYWMLGLIIYGLWAIWSIVKCKCSYSNLKRLKNRYYFYSAVAVGAVCYIVLAHEPYGLKVAYDEYSHASIAQQMHLNREAVSVAKAHNLIGQTVYLEQFCSFRLYFFSTLVSLAHDAFGYSYLNVFFVNTVILIIYLSLLYYLGNCLLDPWGGLVTISVVGGLPLLSQNATSGGYDLLNVTLILALLVSTIYYFKNSSLKSLHLSIAISCMLASTRYESIVYVVIPITLFIYSYFRANKVYISLLSSITPVLLVPAIASNVIFNATDVPLLNEMRSDGSKYFDVVHLRGNVEQAIYYWFQHSKQATNSIFLSVVGVIGFLLLFVRYVYYFNPRTRDEYFTHTTILALFSFIICALYLLTLFNFWGAPTDYAASRFSLVIFTFGVIAFVWSLKIIQVKVATQKVIIFSAFLFIFIHTIPTNSDHYATKRIVTARVAEWFLSYAKNSYDGRTLFVAESSLPTIIAELPTIDTLEFNRKVSKVKNSLYYKIYDRIILLQTNYLDYRTGSTMLYGNRNPDLSEFDYKILKVVKMEPLHLAIIVEISGLRLNDIAIISKNEADMHPYSSKSDYQSHILDGLP
jgi:hypothetical protein